MIDFFNGKKNFLKSHAILTLLKSIKISGKWSYRWAFQVRKLLHKLPIQV